MDTEQDIAQNLQDAGCDSDCIERFLHVLRERKTVEQMRILSKQRDHLLEEIHAGQKQLDCLDFLIYRIRKEHKT